MVEFVNQPGKAATSHFRLPAVGKTAPQSPAPAVCEVSDLQKWEAHCRSFPTGPFLSSPWLECFRAKHRLPVYLRFAAGGKIIGLAGGLRIEPSNLLFRKLFRILFFYTGPAVAEADDESRRMCLENLIGFARENRYTHIKMQSWDYPYEANVQGLPFRPDLRTEYILDMRAKMGDLINRFNKRKMRYVRAAEADGLTFQESSSPKMLDDLLALLEKTKSVRLSKRYENYHYFYISYVDKETLPKLLTNQIARTFYVQRQDHIVCVYLVLVYNHRAYGLFIGAGPEAYERQVPTFITFRIIERLKNEGVEFYNFGGVPSDSSAKGLVRFKTSFGAVEHTCAGGRTHHLQSRLLNHLTDAYSRFPDLKIKKIIKKKLVGRNYS